MNNTANSKMQTKVITNSRPAARVNVSVPHQKEDSFMEHSAFTETISQIKASLSLVDIARSYGLNVRHEGAAICAPHQFRTDDSHPSFAVYKNAAHDFTTGQHYDIFEFVQIMRGCSFKEAVEELAPNEAAVLFAPSRDSSGNPQPDAQAVYLSNRKTLADKIDKWHSLLLENPECPDTFTGQTSKPLDYLYSRGITLETVKALKLGFNPDTKRIIIPFMKNGQPVYYSGRDLTTRWKQINPDTGKAWGKKYLHAFTDVGIEKIIWGLDSIKKHYSSAKKSHFSELEGEIDIEALRDEVLFICEGLLDAVILWQDGWQVLCSGGGYFGQNNLPAVFGIMRAYKKVVLAFDNDKAGQTFTRNLGRLCLTQQIKFTIADIPHEVNAQPVKDINDYYLAGGKILDLARGAESGLAFLARGLTSMDEIYEFAKQVRPFASDHDMRIIKEALEDVKVLEPKCDPDAPDIYAPAFKKGQITSAFKEADEKPGEGEIAERVLAKHTLLYAANSKFYEFKGKNWVQIKDIEVTRYCLAELGPGGTNGRAQAIMKRLQTVTFTDTPFDHQRVFAFQNGVLLLDEKDPQKRFVAHSPNFMNTGIVDYSINPYGDLDVNDPRRPEQYRPLEQRDYGMEHVERVAEQVGCSMVEMQMKESLQKKREAQAEEELPLQKAFNEAGYTPSIAHKMTTWQECCRSWFVDEKGVYDPALEQEAQKMCGYGFFPDNRLEACFLLLGRGSNGKSTFLEIIKEVFGRANCSFLRPDRLSSPFDAMVIQHSWLNICHESSKSLNGAEETLKAVISGNPVTASYKGQDAVSFESRAKWMISANSIMDIKDTSYGFLRRMICLPFNRKFKDKDKDPNLRDKLRASLSEIFWWCYRGYQLLMKGARFEQTPQQAKLAVKLRETIDPCYLFVRESLMEGGCEYFRPDSGNLYTENEIYGWYRDWCQETFNDILPKYQAVERITDAIEDRMPEFHCVTLQRTDEKAPGTYYVMENVEVLDAEDWDEESIEILRGIGALPHEAIDASLEVTPEVPESEASASGEEAGTEDQETHDDDTPIEQTAGAPEAEDKTPAEEGGSDEEGRRTGQDKYPHAGGAQPGPGNLDFVNAIRAYIEAHPETWYADLTPEEYIAYAEALKAAEKRAVQSEDWDGARHALNEVQALRKGWTARQQRKITSSTGEASPDDPAARGASDGDNPPDGE